MKGGGEEADRAKADAFVSGAARPINLALLQLSEFSPLTTARKARKSGTRERIIIGEDAARGAAESRRAPPPRDEDSFGALVFARVRSGKIGDRDRAVGPAIDLTARGRSASLAGAREVPIDRSRGLARKNSPRQSTYIAGSHRE